MVNIFNIYLMSSTSRNNKLLQNFLENPEQYKQIVTEFNSDRDCFESLRDAAKNSLKSFEELFEFYQLFAENGSSKLIKSHFERNSARELKNMILRDSVSGRRFPIRTAAEFKSRIDQYHELGAKIEAENITPHAMTYTLIEHIINKDRHKDHGYDVLDNLLNELPESHSVEVNILVRARLIFAIEGLDSQTNAVHQYVDQFYSDFQDPLPDDNRSASELREAARKESYESQQKLTLIQSSLARKQDTASLHDYLYLSFTDTVERYRHDTRKQPWRGELQLAISQANCLKYTFDDLELSSAWKSRLNSYQRVALGELASGGRWRSQKDPRNLPKPDFKEASKHFLHAANEIQSVDEIRYIKYISKSLRHLATASRSTESSQTFGWSRSKRIHQIAISIMTDMLEQNAGPDYSQTISESIAIHKFKKHEAGVVIAFAQGDPSQMIKEANEAWSIIDNLPVYVDTTILETGKELAEALKLEMEGQTDEAIVQYEQAAISDFDLSCATMVAKIKRDIDTNEYQNVLEIVDNMFED